MNDYAKLKKLNSYDEEAVEELAELYKERRRLEDRLDHLNEIVVENKELKQYVWTTLEGDSIPLHKLETDHLVNIMQHILNRGGNISKAVKSEARKRDLEIPKKTRNNMLGSPIVNYTNAIGNYHYTNPTSVLSLEPADYEDEE